MNLIDNKYPTFEILVIAFALSLLTGCSSLKTSSNGHSRLTEGTPEITKKGVERSYDITGKASMKRLSGGDSGTTIVNLYVEGLHPNEKYPTHVHNLPCGEKGGGGHYQHEKGGKVDDVNEIWLTLTTNSAGIGTKQAEHGYVARPDAQSIVIHDSTADKARIACIDLS
jgi:hypothetical protein